MKRYWLQLWSQAKEGWLNNQAVKSGDTLSHSACDQFRRWGVQPQDLIYVVAIKDAHLHLIGRLEVGRVCNQSDAESHFGANNIWNASDHVIAKPGSATPMYARLIIPDQVALSLEFETKKGITRLVAIDGRRLQTLRRLTSASAHKLDGLLGP